MLYGPPIGGLFNSGLMPTLGEGVLGNFILLPCSVEVRLNGLGPLNVVLLKRLGLAEFRGGPVNKQKRVSTTSIQILPKIIKNMMLKVVFLKEPFKFQ